MHDTPKGMLIQTFIRKREHTRSVLTQNEDESGEAFHKRCREYVKFACRVAQKRAPWWSMFCRTYYKVTML